MAVSNYSAERLFPVMKRLKNYLRSTIMSNSRLNWQAVLTIEYDLIKKLNFEDIKLFGQKPTQKKNFVEFNTTYKMYINSLG